MPHAYSDDALTLARLLQEPVLRRARIHAGRAGAVTRLDWVAPWSVAAQQDDPLAGVLVHAHAGELDRAAITVTGAAEQLAARGAAALLVDGHQPGVGPTRPRPVSCLWSPWPTPSRSPSSTGWWPT